MVVNQQEKKVVVIDVSIQSVCNMRKKEHEKLEKYQVRREELERMWGVKASVVLALIGALRVGTYKLGE